MHKHRHGILGLMASMAVFAMTVQVNGQADMAWASGILADIAVAATQANNALADAADEGADAVQAAMETVSAVAQASDDALAAYSILLAAEGDAAVADAKERLREAHQRAMNAIGAKEPMQTARDDQDEEPLVDPERILWKSPELQKTYAELFEIVNSVSAQGGAEFAERDATPE